MVRSLTFCEKDGDASYVESRWFKDESPNNGYDPLPPSVLSSSSSAHNTLSLPVHKPPNHTLVPHPTRRQDKWIMFLPLQATAAELECECIGFPFSRWQTQHLAQHHSTTQLAFPLCLGRAMFVKFPSCLLQLHWCLYISFRRAKQGTNVKVTSTSGPNTPTNATSSPNDNNSKALDH